MAADAVIKRRRNHVSVLSLLSVFVLSLLGPLFVLRQFTLLYVFCLLVVLIRLSVQVIDWKASPK